MSVTLEPCETRSAFAEATDRCTRPEPPVSVALPEAPKSSARTLAMMTRIWNSWMTRAVADREIAIAFPAVLRTFVAEVEATATVFPTNLASVTVP